MFDNIFNILTPKIDKPVKPADDSFLFDTTFQLPIFYTDKLQLSADIIKDLELRGPNGANNGITAEIDSIDDGIYKVLFDIKRGDIFKSQMVKKWSEYYTTNVDFINDTIKIIKSPELTKKVADNVADDKILTVWKDLKEDEYFLEKYSYMEWSYLENWNNSPLFLWLYACMNILSPIITILIPLIFFVFPVVLMVIFWQPFTFESYFTYLKELSKHHFIGNMIGVIDGTVQFSWDKIMGALVSILFYGISIYQNVISGYHFYNNMKLVNEHLITLRDYLASTNDRIDTFLRVIVGANAPSYSKFVAELKTQQATIVAMQREVTAIKEFALDFKKCGELGTLLYAFYQFHKNPAFETTLKYTMGFNGYFSGLISLSEQYQKDAINSCTIVKEELEIKKQYYPFLGKNNTVANDVTLDKNIILTGSNGCGKSTLMKTTLINVILSQQIGFGFYDSMKFTPYDSFHCYLNIIDTGANNDSLFMAQSRRSKDIMSAIVKGGAHLCILDEIFCGTEIKSCTDSCVAFINELLKNGDCRFILSTHIVDICKKRDVVKSGKVANYKMEVIESGDDIKNTYRLVPGISRVKGALSVFKKMDFPQDFIKYIRDNKSNNNGATNVPPDAPASVTQSASLTL